ncbi:MAG: DUF885 family protein [Actinomycetales bacterium]
MTLHQRQARTASDVAGELARLTDEWWQRRHARAPRSRDDIPRVVRPAGWRPSWDRADVEADLAHARDVAGDVAELRAALGEFTEQLPELEVPLRLLESATSRVVWEIELLASWRRDPWFYLDQSLGHVFDVLLAPAAFDAARAQALVDRLTWVPPILEQSRPNLTGTAFRELAELALADSAAAAEQVRQTVQLVAPELPEEFHGAVRDAGERAAAAVQQWREWLSGDLSALPAHCPVGPEAFAFYLHRVALLPWSATELRIRARQERDRAEAWELFESARSGAGPAPVPDIDAAAQVERERNAELEVRAYYERRGLLTQPPSLRHYVNLPRPPYLEPLRWLGVSDDLTDEQRLDHDGVSYVPQGYASDEMPYFYRANLIDPRAGIIHEGAHFQQLALSWRHPDPAHRRFYDSTPNEGLAFYNEEMLLQAGLFDDAPATRAIVYNFMRLRAIRVEVDVQLALGEIGIDQAAQLLADAVPIEIETAREEASFFAATPGQGLSYQTGKLQLVGLLADCARRQRETFNLRAFHDAVWGDGNVPLAVQRLQLLGDASELHRADALAAATATAATTTATTTAADAAPGSESSGEGAGTHPTVELAERLMRAILSGDADTVADIYANDVVVWHNVDGIERDKDYSVEAVRRMARDFEHFSAHDVRLDLLPDGYLQRCVFHIQWRGDDVVHQAHAAMRVTTRGGQVVRIEEYADSAQGGVPVGDAGGETAIGAIGVIGALAHVDAASSRYRDGSGWEQAAGYSRAARVGRLVAVSGTTAHADIADLPAGDTYEQTRASLRRALAALGPLGARREDVVRSRVLLVPGSDWEAAARAHAELLGDVAPANTTLFVAGLVGPEFLVEVELDAVVHDAVVDDAVVHDAVVHDDVTGGTSR